jgi:hypothetical protein
MFWENQVQTDGLAISRILHQAKEKIVLIDNEALLQGWSEKVFSSDETRKLWDRAIQKKIAKGCVLN